MPVVKNTAKKSLDKNLKIDELSNLSYLLNKYKLAFDFGKEFCQFLKKEEHRLLILSFNENTANLYCNKTIQQMCKFSINKKDDKDFAESEFLIQISNQNLDIKPLILIPSSTFNFNLTLAPYSYAEILLLDNCVLSKNQINQKSNTQESTANIKTYHHKFTLEHDAQLYSAQLYVTNASKNIQSTVKLLGKSAQAYTSTCLVSSGGQFSYEPIQEHHAQHTKSALNFRVVLTENAKSNFRGLVIMSNDAQYSEAHQENKNLLLSRLARADSEPRLEIIPHDVQCKHGSATAELDIKQLNYVMSRGFNEQNAKSMIVKSFCQSAFIMHEKETNLLQNLISLALTHVFHS